jgi:hypothetical protein
MGSFSTGNNLNYITDGKIKTVYGYSDAVGVTNAGHVIWTFNTGQDYIIAKLQIYNDSGSNDNIQYFVYFDGIQIAGWHLSGFDYSAVIYGPVDLVIPPNTAVRIDADNLGSTSPRQHWCKLIGEARLQA